MEEEETVEWSGEGQNGEEKEVWKTWQGVGSVVAHVNSWSPSLGWGEIIANLPQQYRRSSRTAQMITDFH